jgi:probable DNA metabolism protein
MQTLLIQPHYDDWRKAARQLLAQGVAPEEVLWTDNPQEAPLFAADGTGGQAAADQKIHVPAAFLDMARSASAHTDPTRWALLYRVLWRLTRGGERHLLSMATDRDVRQIQEWCKAVGRDIHKMHAFVRFRLVGKEAATDREQFVAWFEPQYRIVRLAAPFFEKRFAGMDWSILTPLECAHWDGRRLHFTAGVSSGCAPEGDELEDLWRTYYRNIFNPARVKISAMQSEMPKKYWKNLPEAPLIGELIAESTQRVQAMLETEERPAKPAPNNPYLRALQEMNQHDAARVPHPVDPV